MKPKFNIIISVPAEEMARVRREAEKYAYTVSIKVVAHNSPEETQGRILVRLKSEQLDSLAQWLSAALLALGSDSEKNRDYEKALAYYLKGLAYNPILKDQDTAYFLHNNAGFSFNKMREYAKGASYCQKAIEINGRRHNAYKNLGISMTGVGNYVEAAKNFLTAAKKYQHDKRAYELLKALLRDHPEVTKQMRPFDAKDCELIQIAEGELIPDNPQELFHKTYTFQPLTEKEKAQIAYVGEFIAPPGTPAEAEATTLAAIEKAYPTDSVAALQEAAKYFRETDPELSEEESLNHAAFSLLFVRSDDFLDKPYDA